MAQGPDSSHVTREFCAVYTVEGPKGTKIVRAPGRTQSLATDFNITFIDMLFSNCCIHVAVFQRQLSDKFHAIAVPAWCYFICLNLQGETWQCQLRVNCSARHSPDELQNLFTLLTSCSRSGQVPSVPWPVLYVHLSSQSLRPPLTCLSNLYTRSGRGTPFS